MHSITNFSNEKEIFAVKKWLYLPVWLIFIACLGLFGMATFITEQRTKEIGVRKVFGSSVTVCGFPADQRFCQMGFNLKYYCLALNILCDEQVVTEFLLTGYN